MPYNEKDLSKDKTIFWKNNQELLNSTYWKNLKEETDASDQPPEVFIPGFHD